MIGVLAYKGTATDRLQLYYSRIAEKRFTIKNKSELYVSVSPYIVFKRNMYKLKVFDVAY